jgi:hypothetical protein
VRLQIVALQLSLFALKTSPSVCSEVDGRSGDQWLRSVLGYLAWRAGDDWRRASDRFSSERREYLQAARLVLALRNAPVESNAPAAAAGPMKSAPQPPSIDDRSRALIVDELMRLNPALTSRKLLLSLSKAKLIRMLDEARARSERLA